MDGVAVEFARQEVAPEAADDEQMIGRFDRAALPGGDAFVVEAIDVMDGAGKAGDQATLLERRQRIAGNAVLRVPDIEAAPLRRLEIADVFGDARFDQLSPRRARPLPPARISFGTACRERNRRPWCRARTPSPRGRGG